MSLDQYWSEEPNYRVERGITVPRLHELAALVEITRREDMHLLGSVMALAQHDPKGLRKLQPRQAPQKIDRASLGALAPVKRKRDPHG